MYPLFNYMRQISILRRKSNVTSFVYLHARTCYTRRTFLLPTLLKCKKNSIVLSVRYLSRKSKNISKSEIKRLLTVAKTEKWKLLGAVFLLFVSSSVTMSVPFCIGKLIDVIMSSNETVKSNIRSICLLLVLIFIIGASANFGRVYLMNISSQKVINNLRKKVYSSILCQETAFFDTNKSGELINRLSADSATVGMSITNNVSDGLRSLFSFIAGSTLMIYTSPQLAAVGLVTVAPVALMAVLFGKVLKKNSQCLQDSLADATQVAEERISNIRTVQAFSKFSQENLIYGSKIDAVINYAVKESVARAAFFGLTGFSGNLIILSVLYYGGEMMSSGAITIGNLTSFLLYAAYVGISIGGLSSFYSELMKGLGASTRLWQLIDRKPLISVEGGICPPILDGCIIFRTVSFAYPNRPDVPVISNLNLTIPAGTVNALVGSSGCGKSTIGSLLLRLYDCQSGNILIDNQDIKSLNLQWLRRNIGLVSQDPVLFSYSIRENVLYGLPEGVTVDDTSLEEVLFKANALDFVKRMPNGLNTHVGEKGVMLSGGQRQRIAIARALLKNPKILILDEATSALDAESEYLVQKSLEDLMKNRTVITIAHRLSTVRKADVIIVLERGQVIEKGNYEGLINQRGSFYRLIQHQNLRT